MDLKEHLDIYFLYLYILPFDEQAQPKFWFKKSISIIVPSSTTKDRVHVFPVSIEKSTLLLFPMTPFEKEGM